MILIRKEEAALMNSLVSFLTSVTDFSPQRMKVNSIILSKAEKSTEILKVVF